MYSSEYASSAWLASIDPTFWSPGVTVQFRGMEYEEEAVVVCPQGTSSYYYIATEEDMGKGAI